MCIQKTTGRGVFKAFVVANEKLCDEHFEIRLIVSPTQNSGMAFPSSAAGQFVQIQCSPTDAPSDRNVVEMTAEQLPKIFQPELTDKQALLRRPISLAGRVDTADGAELEIIYRLVGTGTGWLASAQPGQAISILGPLGNAIPISETKPCVALIGGGVGIPPMIYAAEQLSSAGKTVTAFCGARSKFFMPLNIIIDAEAQQLREGKPSQCCQEFARFDAETSIATDDGSLGHHGLVSEPFTAWLDNENEKILPEDLVVYSCGPEPMMRALGQICIQRNIECYLSLERHMACGMGTCQSCIVKIRDDSEQGWSFKLCCSDGPVFPAKDIVWD